MQLAKFSGEVVCLSVAVAVRKDDALAAGQAASNNVAAAMAFSGGGGLIQTISG